MGQSALTFHPLTPERWGDFEALFGVRGACGGCWCMYWRLFRLAFSIGKGEGNRRAMQKLVRAGTEPGILAYDGERPVGWCAVAPREEYVRLTAARTLKPIDTQPVWSIVCLFVDKGYRRRNVSTELIRAAAAFACARGARIVEGYPYDYRGRVKHQPPPFVYTGLIQAFERAGFVEVARPSKSRAIVRLTRR
ncbi:MAG TPA: GNAT family N-acetyltransferase [candidate division Zixibacteria bacterium]|nr:GNAT family N-acetyltransferase [candidate division Zixibacteria bacterium]